MDGLDFLLGKPSKTSMMRPPPLSLGFCPPCWPCVAGSVFFFAFCVQRTIARKAPLEMFWPLLKEGRDTRSL
jgi:hypothetical protein